MTEKKFTVKNRPKIEFQIVRKNRKEAKAMDDFVEWFVGFEAKHERFYCTASALDEWLSEHKIIDVEGQVSHAIREFIHFEILGET